MVLLVPLQVNHAPCATSEPRCWWYAQVINALEVWARPIKEATLKAAEAEATPAAAAAPLLPSLPSLDRLASTGSGLTPPPPPHAQQQPLGEPERLAAAKSTKDAIERGVALFNGRGPLKGLDYLLAEGLVEPTPAAVRCSTCCTACCVCWESLRLLLRGPFRSLSPSA